MQVSCGDAPIEPVRLSYKILSGDERTLLGIPLPNADAGLFTFICRVGNGQVGMEDQVPRLTRGAFARRAIGKRWIVWFGRADLRGEVIDKDFVGSGGRNQKPVVVRGKHRTVRVLFERQLLDGDAAENRINLPDRCLAGPVVVAREELAVVVGHQIAGSQIYLRIVNESQFAALLDLQRRNRRRFSLPTSIDRRGIHQLSIRSKGERPAPSRRSS